MSPIHVKTALGLVLSLAVMAPEAVYAQGMPGLDDAVTSGGSDSASDSRPKRGGASSGRGSGSRRNRITPYIEAQQIVTKRLSGAATSDFNQGKDVLTYSLLSAGVDASIAGRNNGLSASLRYERRIGYSGSDSGNSVSGIVRGYAGIVPRTLQLDVGALATRSNIQNNGASVFSGSDVGDSVSQIYSVYAGPTLTSNVGDVKVDGHYRLGFTKVNTGSNLRGTSATPQVDIFDKSIVHDAQLSASTRPGVGLPVGVGVAAGYYREDISNLDQRVDDFNARATVTAPVTGSLALVGSVGYEKVKVSSRNALLDANGAPVTDNGRVVTDKSQPRQIAYQSNGLIWDAGVIFRPSRRTQLEAHVGRRYGTLGYYGSLRYNPNDRSSLNLAVYDNISGFGGQVNRALANLSSDFSAIRNPITGNISGCTAGLGGGCLAQALGSVRSATFRARGVQANYNIELGAITAGIGAGYDRRKFIAAQGTILAVANGLVDENYWVNGSIQGSIDANSRYSVNLYANWLNSGSSLQGDTSNYGATLAYYRNLTERLAATAALGVDNISRQEPLGDQMTGSALLGLRYSF
jgi:hypothetical protein